MTTTAAPRTPAARPAGAPTGHRAPARRSRSLRGGVAPYAFIAPFYILYVLFMIVPIGAAIYLSLTEWVGLGAPEFVGLRNYGN
ncbi:hypothetical protein MJ643_30600, partial [Pseudomonas sp. PNPG3]